MAQEYLNYLNSPLKTKVENLLNQSSLGNEEKSVIIEILNYFSKKLKEAKEEYDQLKGDSTSLSKKRSFQSLGTDGEQGDSMVIDLVSESTALPTNKYASFVSTPQPQKPKFISSLYTIKNSIHDVSFMNPRRLYNVVITNDAFIVLYPNGDLIEVIIPFKYVSEIICVPIPETATKQWCVSLVVDLNYQDKKSSFPSTNYEIYIFKFNENKNLKVYESNSRSTQELTELDSFGLQAVTSTVCNKNYILELFKKYLWPDSDKKALEPDPATFVSKKKSMSTKSKTHKFHINCYYKAKEGYLFLLNEGIFYGAKKPSLYFPMGNILSIKVTNVMSRTFNLNIRCRQSPTNAQSSSGQGPSSKKLKSEGDGGEEDNFEFSMIDSVEFDAIMDYIRKHKTEWSTNRNGEFGMNTEDSGQQQQDEDGENEDGNENETTMENKNKKSIGNKGKGEPQNIFTFVDEDESNDEDYHPDNDSDASSSDGSDSESEEEEDSGDEDKEIDLEAEDSENESEEIEEVTPPPKPKTKRTRKTTTKSTSTDKKTKGKKKTEKKSKEMKDTQSTNIRREDTPLSPMMEDKKEEEDEEINEISSNVEEISISMSSSASSASAKRSKRKSSQPKKMTTTTKSKKASAAATKAKSGANKTKSNDSNTNTHSSDIVSPTKSNKKQLTMFDLFNKASSNKSKPKEESKSVPPPPTETVDLVEDDEDEEDEILFE